MHQVLENVIVDKTDEVTEVADSGDDINCEPQPVTSIEEPKSNENQVPSNPVESESTVVHLSSIETVTIEDCEVAEILGVERAEDEEVIEKLEVSPIFFTGNEAPPITAQDSSQKPDEEHRNEALISLYRQKVRKASNELESKFNQYLKHPPAHSSYLKEWKMFYIEKSFKVAVSGKSRFNYLPAWSSHWSKYIRKHKQQELRDYEGKLRLELQIPATVSLPESKDFSEIVELSDISEDELEFSSPPKRRRIDCENRQQETQETQQQPRVYSELERMIIAYQLAYEHLREGKKLAPEELAALVSHYCTGTWKSSNSQPIERQSSTNHLTDYNVLFLYKNFNNLNQNEQANFISFMQHLELNNPMRSKYLKDEFKKQDSLQRRI